MDAGKRRRIAPRTLARARTFRRPMTPAEHVLRRRLAAGQLGGFKFRRQHPIGPYIADFCCISAGLVVELDGDTHADTEACDAERTDWLGARGYRVIRFLNGDVHERMAVVLDAILAACEEKGI